ncbi:MAG: hypothetical protein K8L99_13085 [Anaerolineae bacterium]|nr:hypothetical protein [Anaerolineae bacterium]
MDDIDVTWQPMMTRFWRQRRRELCLHIILFGIINAILLADPYGLSLVATAPPVLKQIGIDNIPWLTIHWATVLLIHILVVASAALWSRVFRAEIAHQLGRDLSHLQEKPKNRLAEDWDEEWLNDETRSIQPLKRSKMGQK